MGTWAACQEPLPPCDVSAGVGPGCVLVLCPARGLAPEADSGPNNNSRREARPGLNSPLSSHTRRATRQCTPPPVLSLAPSSSPVLTSAPPPARAALDCLLVSLIARVQRVTQLALSPSHTPPRPLSLPPSNLSTLKNTLTAYPVTPSLASSTRSSAFCSSVARRSPGRLSTTDAPQQPTALPPLNPFLPSAPPPSPPFLDEHVSARNQGQYLLNGRALGSTGSPSALRTTTNARSRGRPTYTLSSSRQLDTRLTAFRGGRTGRPPSVAPACVMGVCCESLNIRRPQTPTIRSLTDRRPRQQPTKLSKQLTDIFRFIVSPSCRLLPLARGVRRAFLARPRMTRTPRLLNNLDSSASRA